MLEQHSVKISQSTIKVVEFSNRPDSISFQQTSRWATQAAKDLSKLDEIRHSTVKLNHVQAFNNFVGPQGPQWFDLRILPYIINLQMSGQRKLIEIFRTFFDKVVMPSVKNNQKIVSQWKYLNSLISEEHIDYSKLELYLLLMAPEKMGNKQTGQMGSMRDDKASELQRNNFSKKDYFEEQRGVNNEFKFAKAPQSNFLHQDVPNYRNSGLSPNKFIDLNMSKDQPKDSTQRTQIDEVNKRNLMMMLENFHATLINNQQKLQNELKKDRKGANLKQFSEQKKFM